MNTHIQTTKEFIVPLENRPGTLAEVATALGKANVNITGVLLEAQGPYGVLRFIPSDAPKTESWLKQNNRAYQANEVITVNVPNNPGELGRVATTLAKSGVNITAVYPSTTPSSPTAGITIAVDNVATARKALQG